MLVFNMYMQICSVRFSWCIHLHPIFQQKYTLSLVETLQLRLHKCTTEYEQLISKPIWSELHPHIFSINVRNYIYTLKSHFGFKF